MAEFFDMDFILSWVSYYWILNPLKIASNNGLLLINLLIRVSFLKRPDTSRQSESVQNEADANTALKTIRLKNRNGLLIAYLNINSIRNKIEFLRPMISETIDILVIAETKIDDTFPTSQFMIEGL